MESKKNVILTECNGNVSNEILNKSVEGFFKKKQIIKLYYFNSFLR